MKVKKKVLKFSVSLLLIMIMLMNSVSTSISILSLSTYTNKAATSGEETSDTVLLTVDSSDWKFKKDGAETVEIAKYRQTDTNGKDLPENQKKDYYKFRYHAKP